jgi:drug/metabolite transporter (DMT)-like permease
MASGAMASGAQMLCGGLCLGLLSLLTGEHVGVVTTQSVLALIYLFTFGSIIGFTAYGYLLSHASLPVATSYAYVNPLVAVLLGVGFGGETLDAQSVVGLVTLVLAVVLVTWPAASSTEQDPA